MARGSRSHARVKIDRAKARRLVIETSYQASRRASEKARDRIKANIVAKGRVDTGRMRDSVHASHLRDTPTGSRWGITITGPARDYFLFQDQGTRGHGPVTAQFLRFKPKGSNVFVFTKYVRGIEPGHFVRDAFRQVRVGDYL